MSTGLICPNCSTATTFHRLPVSECPQCHQPFPETLRMSAEANLSRQRATRPTLITLGMYLSAVFAVGWASVLTCAPFNVGSYWINDESMAGTEFIQRAGFPIGTLTVLWAAIAYGIARERSWTRLLMIGFWVILDVFVIAEAIKNPQRTDIGVPGTVIFSLIYLGAAGWYLFGKQSVVDYYRALEAEEAARQPTASASHK